MTAKTYTVAEAAEMFDNWPSRVRRFCIDHNIGTVYSGRMRLLTTADITKLRKLFASQRPYKRSKNPN